MLISLWKLLYPMLHFRVEQQLTVLICILAVGLFCGYERLLASRRGKFLFKFAFLLLLLCTVLTIGLYWWRLPRGLSGTYYADASWNGKPTSEDRYFVSDGRRVDRFLDFHPNDFTGRYPFSDNPFSIQWQGYVYVPEDGYSIEVESNFGVWLTLDERQAQTPHTLDFGDPEARSQLRDGWSHDEQTEVGGEQFSFVWSAAEQSNFFLGLPEPSDLNEDYELVLRCSPFSYPDHPEQVISVTLDDQEIGEIPLQEGWQTYRLPFSLSIFEGVPPDIFRVGFQYADVASPIDVLKIGDGRQLAVAVDWAMIQKAGANLSFHEAKASSPLLSRGIHRILLHAQKKESPSFLRLMWQTENRAKQIIPPDYLFPKSHLPAPGSFAKERLALAGIVLYKIALLGYVGGLLICYVSPGILQTLWTRETVYAALILGIGFGLRWAFLLEKQRIDPIFQILPAGADQLNYVFFARGFFRGYWPWLAHSEFFQAPLISFYFILCSLFLGENLFMFRAATVVMTTGSIGLIFLIARRAFNRPIAYITAGMCACNGVLIFYDTSILIAPQVIFLNLAALWFALQWREDLRFRTMVLLGAALGLSALARGNILLIMPVLFLWMLVYFPGSLRKKILSYLLLCLVMLFTISPATVWNYFSWYKHPFVLTCSNGGVTFWIGNNLSSNGVFGYSKELSRETKQRMKATGTSYLDEVLRYIRENPVHYLNLEWKKFKMFWRGYEIGNNLVYYLFRMNSKILGIPWFNFVLIGPLGIIGMILACRQWKTLLLLYGFVAVQLATTLLFFALARYRLPVVPVLSAFAAYTLWSCIQWGRHKQWRPLLLTCGGFCLLYVMLNYPYAAEVYQNHHGEPMPWTRIFRYWDVFFF